MVAHAGRDQASAAQSAWVDARRWPLSLVAPVARPPRSPMPTLRSARPGTAGGGATGPLGPKDGGVYPAGEGFGQNFAGGKIFFTPDTGAHIMTGAILDKYRVAGRARRQRPRFPHHRRGPGPGSRTAATPRSAPPTTPSSSGPPTPAPGWCAARSTRRGTNSAAPSGVARRAHRGRDLRRRRRLAEVHRGEVSYDRKTKTFTTGPARSGRPARRTSTISG